MDSVTAGMVANFFLLGFPAIVVYQTWNKKSVSLFYASRHQTALSAWMEGCELLGYVALEPIVYQMMLGEDLLRKWISE